MIVITGATGTLGGLVVRHLLDRLPAREIAVSVRDPEKAEDLEARGVRVRQGDFARPDTLAHAFEGADQVLVVSVNQLGDEAVAQHLAAVDAAYAAGAGRVLYTSHQAAGADSAFAPARDHARTEAHLAASGHAYTALRDGFHAASLLALLGDARETGELAAPADGPISWTIHADLAEGIAALLVAGDRPDADVATLTAETAVDLQWVADRLGLRRVVLDDDAYVARQVDRGVPEVAARLFLGMFEAARRGEFDVVDPTLPSLLGRTPQRIEDVL